jgi:hypothetical protein
MSAAISGGDVGVIPDVALAHPGRLEEMPFVVVRC